MQDPYQTYQEPSYEEPYYEEPKKKMSGWLIALIIILVLIAICCLCSCVSMTLFGPAVGNTFSIIIEEAITPIP